MTMTEPDGSVGHQILVKVAELGVDMAVIKERTAGLPELNRQVQQNTTDIAVLKAESATGRDTWARVIGTTGVLAAVGATIAAYVRH